MNADNGSPPSFLVSCPKCDFIKSVKRGETARCAVCASILNDETQQPLSLSHLPRNSTVNGNTRNGLLNISGNHNGRNKSRFNLDTEPNFYNGTELIDLTGATASNKDKMVITIFDESENEEEDMIVWSESKQKATDSLNSKHYNEKQGNISTVASLPQTLHFESDLSIGIDDSMIGGFGLEPPEVIVNVFKANDHSRKAERLGSAWKGEGLGSVEYKPWTNQQNQNPRKRARENDHSNEYASSSRETSGSDITAAGVVHSLEEPFQPNSFYYIPLQIPEHDGVVRTERDQTKRRDIDNKKEEIQEPAIRAGGQRQGTTFSNLIENVPLRSLLPLAKQRTEMLAALLGTTKQDANSKRVMYEKGICCSRATLWSYATGFAKYYSTPTSTDTTSQSGKNYLSSTAVARRRKSDPEFSAPVNFGSQRWKLLRKNLQAHEHREHFQQWLDSIEGTKEGIDCPICCDTYSRVNIVFCGNGKHCLCVKCFHRYMLETIQTPSISCVPCTDPSCASPFSKEDTCRCLSEWDQMRLLEREEELIFRVGLAGETVLDCICGTVGIVQKVENECGNQFSCPGCPLEFCLMCGNEYHNGQGCPPPPETLDWVDKTTKPCPNCAMPIEKNGGCDHMHCKPPGGCGYHFSYSTGKPH